MGKKVHIQKIERVQQVASIHRVEDSDWVKRVNALQAASSIHKDNFLFDTKRDEEGNKIVQTKNEVLNEIFELAERIYIWIEPSDKAV